MIFIGNALWWECKEEFGGFTIEFHQENGNESIGGNSHVPENRLNSIVELIKKDTNISMLDLSKKLEVNHKTIKRDIEKLKTLGILKRVDPAKSGHWQITNS
jgi:predicted HTH transcriptional regulator